MIQYSKYLISIILCLSSLPAFSLVILQYHHISTQTPISTSISPQRFEQHLRLIAQSGFNVVSLEHVARKLREGKPLQDKTVVITFDDGYESIYSNAFKLLKKRQWPFTVFINTLAHDQNLPTHMSWAQLKELQFYGATIANHSVNHHYLLRRSSHVTVKKMIAQEVLAAENRIQEKLGKSLKLFAYPYGEYDAQIMKELNHHGFIGFGQHSGAVANDVDLTQIPRFPFGGNYGEDQDFLIKLHTLPIDNLKTYAVYNEKKLIDAPFIQADVSLPIWKIYLPEKLKDKQVNCFASNQGKIQVKNKSGVLSVYANKAIKAGRSKYNCTIAAGNNRFYWISQVWVKPDKNKGWVHN